MARSSATRAVETAGALASNSPRTTWFAAFGIARASDRSGVSTTKAVNSREAGDELRAQAMIVYGAIALSATWSTTSVISGGGGGGGASTLVTPGWPGDANATDDALTANAQAMPTPSSLFLSFMFFPCLLILNDEIAPDYQGFRTNLDKERFNVKYYTCQKILQVLIHN